MWQPLKDSEPLYRPVTKKIYIDEGTISPEVFMRRRPKLDGLQPDADGLSVSLLVGRTGAETCEAMAQEMTTHFVCCVLTGDVRTIPVSPNLVVVQDMENHACITGTPFLPQDVNTPEGQAQLGRARDVGVLVSGKAVLVWTNPSPKK